MGSSDGLAPDSPADFAVPTAPAPLLPLLTLEEAQDAVEVLARVAAGEHADMELARSLAMNLAARVPSLD